MTATAHPEAQHAWSSNLLCLWQRRRLLTVAALTGTVLFGAIGFSTPKRYDSTTSIMPPEQQTPGAAMLAAIAGRAGASSGMGGFAQSLFGVKSNGDLYIDLLRSGNVRGHLIDRFHLQEVYHKRYVVDTARRLAARTDIVENKKSGVITVTVSDTDPHRAQQMAQAYIDELNNLLASVSTSSARRERIFVEQRLTSVQRDLSQAQQDLSRFSSSTSTIDIKEQTRATVDAGAKLQAQLIVAQSDLESLRQIYGDENVRVRSARERVGVLSHELSKIGGAASDTTTSSDVLYPPLRRLPALGVQFADLYRRVRVQEAVFDLLSAEYENARIQEAREVPTVSVIDAAGWPEKKSFPHRSYYVIAGFFLALFATSAFILARRQWQLLPESAPLKHLVLTIRPSKATAAGFSASPAQRANAEVLP